MYPISTPSNGIKDKPKDPGESKPKIEFLRIVYRLLYSNKESESFIIKLRNVGLNT